MSINLQKGKVEWIENHWLPVSTATNGVFVGRCAAFLGNSATLTHIANGAARLGITATETDTAQIHGPLAFEVDESTYATLYARLRITDVSVASVFIGFTDEVKAEVPIEDEDGTLQTNATDACGILLEGEQDETWQTVGVQNDTDNSQTAIGAGTDDVTVPDATDNNWFSVIIELDGKDSGTMKVWLEDANGQMQLCATRTAFFRSSVALSPVICADARNSAYNVDVAEFGWSGNRGAFFD